MASDEDYTAFLEKANQDTGASKLSSASGTAATKAVDTEVPEGLKKVEAYYVSDADEPFEPVSLKWKGKSLPSESRRIRAWEIDPNAYGLFRVEVLTTCCCLQRNSPT